MIALAGGTNNSQFTIQADRRAMDLEQERMNGPSPDRRMIALPIAQAPSDDQPVTSCDGCGVCCREQPLPPFLDDIDLIPPELQREMAEAIKIEAQLWALGQPCIWFEPSTGKCRHHEHRPNICREYEIGGELCLETRARWREKSGASSIRGNDDAFG